MNHILVLNADYQPFDIWPWQKVMSELLCRETVVPVYYSDRTIRDGRGNIYRVPSVVVLKHYMNSTNKAAKYSKNNIYARDLCVCQYCGKKTEKGNRTVDHVIPKSLWSKKRYNFQLNSFENVVTCCQSCNEYKGNRTPQQAGMTLINSPKKITRSEIYKNKLKLIKIQEEWREFIYNVNKEKAS